MLNKPQFVQSLTASIIFLRFSRCNNFLRDQQLKREAQKRRGVVLYILRTLLS